MNNEDKQKASLDAWVSMFHSCMQKNKDKEGMVIRNLSAYDIALEADKYYREIKERFPFLLSLDEVKNECS